MKSQDIDKLYRSLTNHERAVMAFKSMAKSDFDSANKISDSVERETYTVIDRGYLLKLNWFFVVAHQWAIEYWKCQSKLNITISQALISGKYQKDDEIFEDSVELLELWRGRLHALFLLLDDLAKTHDVNKNAVLIHADIGQSYGDNITLDNLSDASRKYHNQLRDGWISCLSALNIQDSNNDLSS